MTSGNVSDEPIAFATTTRSRRLAGIADLFLVHDRPIADAHATTRSCARARAASAGR